MPQLPLVCPERSSDRSPPTRDAADLMSETIVPFAKLAQELDKNIATLHRWAKTGIQRPTGRVRLESFRLGAAIYTTREGLARFLRRINPDTTPGEPAVTGEAAPRRQRELATVDRELDEAGI
jgi:hypothetical protein